MISVADSGPHASSPQRIRVLVAEDDEGLSCMLEFCLDAAGFEVVEIVSNGREACRSYFENRPDLVLMDIRMPLMDGISALRKIRAEDPEAVVLLMTGNLNIEYEKQAREAGVAGFIEKPFKMERLAQDIEQVVRQRVGS